MKNWVLILILRIDFFFSESSRKDEIHWKYKFIVLIVTTYLWVIIAVDCFLDTDSLEMLGIGSDSTSNDAKDLGVPQLFSESFKVFWWVIFPKQTRFFPFGLKWAPVLLKRFLKKNFML